MKCLGGNFQAIPSTQATQGSCCHPREYPTEPLRRLHAPHEHPLQPGNHPAELAPQWTPSSGTRHVPSPTYSRATKPGPFPIRMTCVESVFQLKVRPDSGFPGALRIFWKQKLGGMFLGYMWFQRVIGPNAVFTIGTIGTIGSQCCPVT